MSSKNSTPLSQDQIAEQLRALDIETAAKREELQAMHVAEQHRRRPLAVLLERRQNLKTRISKNLRRVANHQADVALFDRRCDEFFLDENQESMVPLFNAAYTEQHGVRAVAMLSARLNQAGEELAALNAEIVALAAKDGLQEMLPADLVD